MHHVTSYFEPIVIIFRIVKYSFIRCMLHRILSQSMFIFDLQRETLLRQLDTNSVDIESTLEELNIHAESEDQNYDM